MLKAFGKISQKIYKINKETSHFHKKELGKVLEKLLEIVIARSKLSIK